MLAALALLAGVALLLGRGGAFTLPVGARAVEPGTLVYAAGDQLHLGDRTVRVSPAPDAMVLTSGGLYYVHGSDLLRWTPDGSDRVADLGDQPSLVTSADGRYLGLVDRAHGPRNLRGQRVAEVVVLDTSTGRQVVRSAAGNGSRWGTEDLDDTYQDSTPQVLGFAGDRAFAVTAHDGGVRRYDLGGGASTVRSGRGLPDVFDRPTGAHVDLDLVDGRVRIRPPGEGASYAGRRTPDGGTTVFTDDDGRPFVFRSADEVPQAVELDADTLTLVGWLDDDTFVGTATDTTGATRRAWVVRCSAQGLRCDRVGDAVPADGDPFVFPSAEAPVS